MNKYKHFRKKFVHVVKTEYLATSSLLAAKTLKVLNIEWKAMLNT